MIFENVMSEFVYLRTYSRYLWEEGRRETFEETVDRYLGFVLSDPKIPAKVRTKARSYLLALEVAPSMRALWTAGGAAAQSNATMYNCSFLTISDLDAFGETLYLLMCGTGVGFSCEQRYVGLLPLIRPQRAIPPLRHVVDDSRRGWKHALDIGVQQWFDGRDVFFDFSRLRPMGTLLKTMGGRSSGGDVLRQLLQFTRETVMAAQGRRLTPLECHDIMCEIASVVVVGGVRRSALISLSDLENTAMRRAKAEGCHARRFGANNSAVYYDMPDMIEFLDEWVSLAKSGRGERGIANLWAGRRNAPHRRKSKLLQGLNPCGEVVLRDREFCNVTEAAVRADDDFESLRDKITTAAWLGVIQSTFTDFPNLSPAWTINCEDERLIGVSLTGQMDNPSLLSDEVLNLLKQHCRNTARKAAKILGVRMPAATTCVKPSGTVQKLFDCSAGLHPRWAKYYTQNLQISKADPLFRFMADQGAPWQDTPYEAHTAIISFPVKSPDGAITRHDMTAIDQLEWYKKIVTNWCEHNASCTVYVAQSEWLSVANWVYENFSVVNGVSFFPKDDHTYPWSPNVEITEQQYMDAIKAFPDIDFSKLSWYEEGDQTSGSKELACVGDQCSF